MHRAGTTPRLNTKVMHSCALGQPGGKDQFEQLLRLFGTGTNPWSTDTNDLFARRKTHAIATVEDGTSNRIAFVEGLAGDFNQLRTPSRQYVGCARQRCIQLTTPARTCRESWPSPKQCMQAIQTSPGSNNDRGYRWQTGSPGLSLTNIILTPNSSQYPFSGCRWDWPPPAGSTSATSTYRAASTRGVNVLFTDGWVRFVRSSLAGNLDVADSKNGGEVISSDSF